MRPIKRFEHGGMHWDIPEEDPTKRELRRQEREDKKGMIPARFRNRGQLRARPFVWRQGKTPTAAR